MDNTELKKFLIDLIDEEFSPRPVALAKRWAGGTLILKPDNDTQVKEVPLEIFFKKITGIREALRVLEQKLNNHDALGAEDKATLQSYVTKCYGSLTTFNVLFRDDKDKFVGAGSGSSSESSGKSDEKLTVAEARRRLGLNEYKKD
jgi:hypothetical protein